MKGFKIIVALTFLLVCTASAKDQPIQVVYRFDDHRYLELKGWGCQGELWYTDTLRKIHSQPGLQFYQIFTRKFQHPSEKYIAIPWWGAGGFTVSKNYGQTWQVAPISPGSNEPDGGNAPSYEDVLSFTVVNDQGFLQTKHSLYMSSKPFEDPRILPGGPGIPFTAEDGAHHILKPSAPGEGWGMVYMTKLGLKENTSQFKTNWQDLPQQIPEVKNYQGWDHMRCDMDAGKTG